MGADSREAARASGGSRRSRAIRRVGPRPGDRRVAEARWRWALAGFGALLLGTWTVAWATGGSVRPVDPVGAAFGIVATLLLLIAAAYGLRRRAMGPVSRLGLGHARTWLELHVHGSLLFLLAMFLHTGLAWPKGAFSWCLWSVSIWTVLTGLLGLSLQRIVPRLLAAGRGVEVHYDRIPELVGEIRVRAESLVADAGRPVRRLYERRLAPALAAPRRDLTVFFDAGGRHRRLEQIARLHELLEADEGRRLTELEELVQAKLDLDARFTLEQTLRAWLWLHVPASMLLVVLVLVHIGTVVYYGGFFLWS
ncbi:MAG: hypothetical protein MI919_03835 [Holophagales bacterium]|nr:hypothetical protein [Holophagales bacterium]